MPCYQPGISSGGDIKSMAEEVSTHRAQGWGSPVNALMLMSVANYLSFATRNALHTNFAIYAIHLDGTDMGILHMVREIPPAG